MGALARRQLRVFSVVVCGIASRQASAIAAASGQRLEKELAEQQIYFLKHLPSTVASTFELQFDAAFFNQAQLYFYTSGSTGQPKKIPRSLQQLFNEVCGLDASFDLPEQAIAIATVSHQHIYGLLF